MMTYDDVSVLIRDTSKAEDLVSHLSKLTAESMLSEIKADVAKLEAAVLARDWKLIATHASELRGYAFNAFALCHAHMERQGRQNNHFIRALPRPRPTIDDLLL